MKIINGAEWLTMEEASEELWPGGKVRPEYLRNLLIEGNYPIKDGYGKKPDLVKKDNVVYIKALIAKKIGNQ